MKISKPLVDVLANPADKDLIFSSELKCLKVLTSALIDTDASGNVTIAHNLGYVPSFITFQADLSALGVWMAGVPASADASNIYVQGAMAGVQSKIFYIIFVDQLV